PRTLDALDHAVHVVRMMHRLPAPPPHLFERRPGEIIPAPVVPVDRAARICHPRELRNALRERAELFLAHASLGDVYARADEVERPSIGAEDCAPPVHDPVDRAIRPYDAKLLVEIGAVACALPRRG